MAFQMRHRAPPAARVHVGRRLNPSAAFTALIDSIRDRSAAVPAKSSGPQQHMLPFSLSGDAERLSYAPSRP
ncbi:MAG: hypothetical protein ACYC3W_01070, partial [Candidatus Nanopelagicales bacterium]